MAMKSERQERTTKEEEAIVFRRANPLIMVELTARALVARLLGKLDLLDTKPKRGPGRPPKRSGW